VAHRTSIAGNPDPNALSAVGSSLSVVGSSLAAVDLESDWKLSSPHQYGVE
jgi:hypothetical protein